MVSSAVPLFFMVNGALLLNKDYKFNFKKSFLRLLYPLLIWSIIGALVANYYTESFNFKMNILKIIGINIPSEGTRSIYHSYHFWYIYTLLSIYLIISPLKKMIASLSQKDCLYLITIWFVFVSLVPLLTYYFKIKISLTPFLFTGHLGFYLLGYYLNNFIVINSRKVKITLFSILIICTVVPWLLTWHNNLHAKKLDFFFYGNFNIFMLLQSTVLFYMAKLIFTKPNKIVIYLARLSFTAYCCHVLVLYFIKKYALIEFFISHLKDIPLSVELILQFSLVVVLSYFIAFLISLLPKKVSAYFGV